MSNSATPWTIQFMECPWPEYWSGLPFPSPRDLLNPGIEPRSLTLQADSLPAEPQGKPKNTGVGSPPLLQRLFLTQELNRHLLNYRRILYQLSYQGRTHSQYYFGLILYASSLFYMLVAMSIQKHVAKPPKKV